MAISILESQLFMIEPCVTAVCTCLPHPASLARQFHQSVFTSLGSRGKSNSASSNKSWKPGSIYRGQLQRAGDEEIRLTNDVRADGKMGRLGAVGNGSRDGDGGDKRDHDIFVQSSFVQSMNKL